MTLNDPVYVEAAQALRRRIVSRRRRRRRDRCALCLPPVPGPPADRSRSSSGWSRCSSRPSADSRRTEPGRRALATEPLGPLPAGHGRGRTGRLDGGRQRAAESGRNLGQAREPMRLDACTMRSTRSAPNPAPLPARLPVVGAGRLRARVAAGRVAAAAAAAPTIPFAPQPPHFPAKVQERHLPAHVGRAAAPRSVRLQARAGRSATARTAPSVRQGQDASPSPAARRSCWARRSKFQPARRRAASGCPSAAEHRTASPTSCASSSR